MAFDKDFHVFPKPVSGVAGRNNPRPGNFDIGDVARQWKPKGSLEPDVATLARFSQRIATGRGGALAGDDLGGLTPATAAVYYVASWGNSASAMPGNPNRPFPVSNAVTVSIPSGSHIVALDDLTNAAATFRVLITGPAVGARQLRVSGPVQVQLVHTGAGEPSIEIHGDGQPIISGQYSAGYSESLSDRVFRVENCRIGVIYIGMWATFVACRGGSTQIFLFHPGPFYDYGGSSGSMVSGEARYQAAITGCTFTGPYIVAHWITATTSTLIFREGPGGMANENSYVS